jgi:glycosyltransferase involved in cell wall biosynthesis
LRPGRRTTMTAAFVSCLMPTANRRAFVPSAIAHFLRQDYHFRELVIVDDGSEPVADLVPSDERIRYERLPKRTVLGKKRNIACECARGDLLVNWDDDDWFASWRLRYQVEQLESSRSEVSGLDRLWYYDPARNQAWRYIYGTGPRWVAGGTCCYTRDGGRHGVHFQKPFEKDSGPGERRFLRRVHSSREHEQEAASRPAVRARPSRRRTPPHGPP